MYTSSGAKSMEPSMGIHHEFLRFFCFAITVRSLRSQWQAQVQAIPRAVASARGAIGLVQQLQRPVLAVTPQKMGGS